MTKHEEGAKLYRFGVFELDTTRGELRRQGVRVRLHTQPYQVLLLLLEHPGEVLEREQITRVLWPEGTFVDAEHGVNSAINRLREALGDKAANARYVETVARRGYRFVAPVERTQARDEQAGMHDEIREEIRHELETSFTSRFLATPDELPTTSRKLAETLFLLLQAMYLGFYVGALANLTEIEELFAPLRHAAAVFNLLLVSAAVLIPVRLFLGCAVLFRAPGVRGKILRMWPLLVVADLLWSLAPFLLLHHINYGLALAFTTILVYAPFAERSLVLMGAGAPRT